MRRGHRIPCALTIAGSDSGGGAGIQADLKTFAALGVHGTSVVTCVTAQNPRAILGVQEMRPAIVRSQLEAVATELRPQSAKTGMLCSRRIIELVASFLADHPHLVVVVDPVMVATSGAVLLQPSAIKALGRTLLPRAALVTPNLDEARILSGVEVRKPDDLREAARIVHERYGCASLIKGGHMAGTQAVDVFWDGHKELLLSAKRVVGISSHGTGCTYSAAIVGYLARGLALSASVARAKLYITQSIAGSRRLGRHWVLGTHFQAAGAAAALSASSHGRVAS